MISRLSGNQEFGAGIDFIPSAEKINFLIGVDKLPKAYASTFVANDGTIIKMFTYRDGMKTTITHRDEGPIKTDYTNLITGAHQ